MGEENEEYNQDKIKKIADYQKATEANQLKFKKNLFLYF